MHTDIYINIYKSQMVLKLYSASHTGAATYLKTQALHSIIIMAKLAGAGCFCYARIKTKLQGMVWRKYWNCPIPGWVRAQLWVLLFLLCPAPRCLREVTVPQAAVLKPSTRQGPTLHKVCSQLWCGNVARSRRGKI